MNVAKTIAFFSALLLITPTAFCDESREPKILTIVKSGEKARKQYCYTTFTIDEGGNWTATTKFSNGKNLDGDHYRATLVIKDKDGKDYLAVSQVAGVKSASMCSGSCERDLYHSGTSVVTSHDLTENAAYECAGYNGKDDLGIAVGVAVSIGCYVAGAPCTGVMP